MAVAGIKKPTMTPESQIAALASLDGPPLFVIHKPIHDPFGYYRENAHGYTTLAEAWTVTEEVGKRYIGGRPTDYDRVVLEPAPTKPYLTNFDPTIRLIQKRGMQTVLHETFWITATPASLAADLLKAEGLWQDDEKGKE